MRMTLEELCENFDVMDSWDDRYSYLMELGNRLPAMPDGLKNETTRVSGCASQVFIAPLPLDEKGGMHFLADSDSRLVRGLIAILMTAVDGSTPRDILEFDMGHLLLRLGLGEHISSGRKNGLAAMMLRIRALAESAKT